VDHIFTSNALRPTGLQVHRTPLARVASDHFPLVAELTLENKSGDDR
jgi:endonuclease/exonuclease/phosphatase family metal-dependent hydrolase